MQGDRAVELIDKGMYDLFEQGVEEFCQAQVGTGPLLGIATDRITTGTDLSNGNDMSGSSRGALCLRAEQQLNVLLQIVRVSQFRRLVVERNNSFRHREPFAFRAEPIGEKPVYKSQRMPDSEDLARSAPFLIQSSQKGLQAFRSVRGPGIMLSVARAKKLRRQPDGRKQKGCG